ncbi:cytoplasmic dynein 2 light intermediate chain 1-like [Saccoglossus kowalevskii]|uniref:Cytoplasmic dynein 2 light intermediate chain 1 n=1 Tax=Saccoglossus kowalevskii TaxID=10224 RepID=A0ABM0GM12_SACKO|nr:PREDICTED: cytoplasmic dynein 2 light intermediate chain 1-like [Saccoglossus kowalevskii]
MSRGERNLWDIAINEAEISQRQSHQTEGENQEGLKRGEESSVFFIGSKDAGKTSIILRFLDKDEIPKPTTALEYTFGRRAKGHNIAKDVGHIWELGGGTFLSKLVEIPINAECLENLAIVLILDLSKPHELWHTMETLLNTTRQRIEKVMQDASMRDSTLQPRMKNKAWSKFGEDHPDKDMIEPFPVPLVIIGCKYDVFQDFDSEKRKVICRTLRFVAHSHGATLQFCSLKTESLVTRTRQLISHFVFNTASSKAMAVDPNKPVIVPAGMDSLQQIGPPPVAEGDIGKLTARNPLELWKQAYTAFFPQQISSSVAEDPAKDPQYSESAVDNMRAQKDEELERYRRQSERKAKDLARGGGMEAIRA